MSKATEIIEVKITYFRENDEISLDSIDGHVTYPAWEDCTEDLPYTEPESKADIVPVGNFLWHLREGPRCKVLESFAKFEFTFVGESVNWFETPLEWESAMIGLEDVFEGYLADLLLMGDEVIQDYRDMNHPAVLNARKQQIEHISRVKFLTLWEYWGTYDSYYGDFDSSWDLIGRINLAELAYELQQKSKSS